MLTFHSEEKNSSAIALLGTASANHSVRLISDSVSIISDVSNGLLNSSDCGLDSCSFYNGPSDSTIMSFGQQSESCGSIAYSGSSESCGSIAYSGSSESCGSIASSSCGSACSYSC